MSGWIEKSRRRPGVAVEEGAWTLSFDWPRLHRELHFRLRYKTQPCLPPQMQMV